MHPSSAIILYIWWGAWIWAWERLGWVCISLTSEGRTWSWQSLLLPDGTIAHSVDSAWSLCPPWSQHVEVAQLTHPGMKTVSLPHWGMVYRCFDWWHGEPGNYGPSVHPVMGHLWGSTAPTMSIPCWRGSNTKLQINDMQGEGGRGKRREGERERGERLTAGERKCFIIYYL